MKIKDSFTPLRRVTQATLDRLVLNFVFEADQPFSVVETQSVKIETLHSDCTQQGKRHALEYRKL